MKLVLADLFPNQAQIRILRTLVIGTYWGSSGINLRLLAELSQSGLQSTERVVQSLLHKKLIKRVVAKRQTLFKLNSKSAAAQFLKNIFSLEMENLIQHRARSYNHKPAEIFRFINTTNEYLNKVRLNYKQRDEH